MAQRRTTLLTPSVYGLAGRSEFDSPGLGLAFSRGMRLTRVGDSDDLGC